MKNVLLNFRNEISLTLRNLAEQDFKEAVQHLINLKSKIDSIINNNEIKITKRINKDSMEYETMKPLFPKEELNEFKGDVWLTNIMDITNLKIKNVYIEFDNHKFIFDLVKNEWIKDY